MSIYFSELDTPALIIDTATVAANLRRMQAFAADHNLALRPHIKTHKMTWLAKDQLALGAVGIAVAKLGEAECMLEAGITDIHIANQVVGAAKITRLISLCQRGEITCAVDSVANARQLNAAFSANGLSLAVLIEVNSGLNRCGVATPGEALALAAAIDELSSLRLAGIMTHAGHAYGAASIDRVAEIGRQEGTIMVDMARQLRAASHAIDVVSVGSTPTAAHVVAIPGLTELRVGNYVFNDMMQVALGSAVIEQCALSVMASVISTPAPGRVVLDAGSKALGLDRGAHGHSLPRRIWDGEEKRPRGHASVRGTRCYRG